MRLVIPVTGRGRSRHAPLPRGGHWSGKAGRIALLMFLLAGLSGSAPAQPAPGGGAAPEASLPRPTAGEAAGFTPEAQLPPGPEETPDQIFEPPPPLPPALLPEAPAPPFILSPAPLAPPEAASALGTASEVIRVILGLIALFALALLGAHPKVRKLERKLRLSGVVTAGLPFVLLGFVASLPGVGVLPETVLWVLRPVLALALGWIGFAVGFRFDAAVIESLRRQVAAAGFFIGSITFASILVLCGVLLIAVEPSAETGAFFRDAILIASAGTVIARSGPHLPARREGGGPADPVWGIIHLQQLAGIIGLLVVAAYFRPNDATFMWQLPGTAWLFITLGMGTAVGGVVYATLSSAKPGPDFGVVLLGSVCFTAGMASFLRLSPIVVCFFAGFILANLPFRTRALVRSTLVRLERPIYLIFLLISGSLLRINQWQGWAVALLLVVATIVGRSLALELCRRRGVFVPAKGEKSRLTLAPLGALSIAVAVNAQLLYSGPAVPWLVTGVIGASIVKEVLAQSSARGLLAAGAAAETPPGEPAEGMVP
ncbi:MAG: hypothetical protein IT159_16250 [Bryobacterales bacterium]|nr:hypothetical protein [Bryobacterales bacterium]